MSFTISLFLGSLSNTNTSFDLSKKFAEAGYNFVSISYKDDDAYKREVIEEFSKPDTSINGLIATDILTKGFDVPDVKIGVSARPFSKVARARYLAPITLPSDGVNAICEVPLAPS